MTARTVTFNTEPLRQHAIRRIVMGNPAELRSTRMPLEPESAPPFLTPRQLEVLALLCEGLANKLIARRLNISAATVKAHIGSILRELGVSSRLQAVVAAPRLGLVNESTADISAQGDQSTPPRQLRMFLNEVLRPQVDVYQRAS